MGYFFLVSWTPVLLSSANIPLGKAALAQSLFQFGGAIGGWILCRPMDTKGLTPIAILFVIAIPAVALIGYLGTISEPLLMIAEFFAGFCVLGGQFGLNAVSALIYPTSFRSKGAGWALGIGRIGSIGWPNFGRRAHRHAPTRTTALRTRGNSVRDRRGRLLRARAALFSPFRGRKVWGSGKLSNGMTQGG